MIGKFKTFAIALVVGALVVGGVLSVRLARQPPPAFPLPAATGSAAPADPDGSAQAELRDSLKEGREAEAAPMSKWPGVARRDGDVLTIAADGRDLASFTDADYCDGFDQCSRWRFQGVLTLGGKAYPWLTLFHGEGEETAYMVDASGRLFGAQGDPSASPDGRWLVVAYDEPDVDGAVAVFESGPRGLRLVATGYGSQCQAGAWKSDRRLAMTCTDSSATEPQRSLAADLVRDARGWRITPTAELDGKTHQSLARPTRPLAETALTAVNDDEAIEDDAYEVKKGYRRL